MKIVLINIELEPSLFIPMAQEMLTRAGHECKYMHIRLLRGTYDKKLLKKISRQITDIEPDAGLIGFSIMTHEYFPCRDLIRELRKRTDAKIILGGIHPTVRPMECLDIADFICVGEGEYALVELADRLDENRNASDIQNIYTKDQRELIGRKQRPLVQDLDDLPVPSFDLKKWYIYFDDRLQCVAKNPKIINRIFPKTYILMTARGCPYKCSYCVNAVLGKLDKDYSKIRRRSNKHVIEEIMRVKKVFNFREDICFIDDDFFSLSEDMMKDLMRMYKK